VLGSAPGHPAASGGMPGVKAYEDGVSLMVAPAPSLDPGALGSQ
jgi:hypothetical protein